MSAAGDRGTVKSGGPGGRRLVGEAGVALPAVVALLVVALLITAVGSRIAINAIGEPRRDRASTEALAGAEAALDVVMWRMNKQLVAAQIEGPAGLAEGLVGTLGCMRVEGSLVQLPLEEGLEECEDDVATGTGLGARCRSALTAELLPTPIELADLEGPLTRDVICRATRRGATRKIWARLAIDLSVEGTVARPTSLWRRESWTECIADPDLSAPCLPT